MNLDWIPSPALRELELSILTQEAPRPSAAMLTPHSGAAIEPRVRRTRRVVTVLRADVVRSLDDDALDPEILESLERRALEIVGRAIERHGGIIDLAGLDGVTAVFGLAVAREDDALRAVRAAGELRSGRRATGSTDEGVSFRVGIATGAVLARSRDAHGSLMSGATLQIATALAARAGPDEVLLSGDTERLVRGATSTVPLPPPIRGSTLAPSAVRLFALTDDEVLIPRSGTPFVGRAAELRALQAAFEGALSSDAPRLVTVIGAPGVGKSRLVAEALAVIGDGARVLRSRCLPYGEGITYWPIRDLVLSALGIGPDETLDEAFARLGSLLSDLNDRDLVRRRVGSAIGLAGATVPSEEIPWAVRRFFEALASERPVIVLVDDLQWAEPALIDVLEHVIDVARGPILLVTVARPELEGLRPDLLARQGLLTIRLDALDEADARTLLDHLAPELPAGPLRSRIVTAAEGNPLFVEQFVAYASDANAADRRTLDDRTKTDLPIPPTIGALLAARLDGLPERERHLLECAAVVGRTFWPEAVADLIPDTDRADFQRGLADMVQRDLIRPERSDVAEGDAYRFRHLLIRDAAYASLPKSERAELHERFAGWLAVRWTRNPAEVDVIVAYHREQAFRYHVELRDDGPNVRRLGEQALGVLSTAGQAALERGDPNAATSLLRRALDLRPSSHRRIELLQDLRSALRTSGDREASDAVDAEVVALMVEHPNEGLQHRRRLIEGLFTFEGTIEEAQDAYAYYERCADRLGMIGALEMAFEAHSNRGQFSQALEQLDEATELALEIGQPSRTARFSARAAIKVVDSPVPVPEALARCWRFLELAGDKREPRAAILLSIGELEARRGVVDDWRNHFEAAKAIIDDLGLVLPLGARSTPWGSGMSSCLRATQAGPLTCCVGAVPPWTSSATRVIWPVLRPLQPGRSWRSGGLKRRSAMPYGVEASPIRMTSMRKSVGGSPASELRSGQDRHAEAADLAREAVALLELSEFPVSLGLANLRLATALRAGGDEPAGHAAALEAERLATARQDQAALRAIAAAWSPVL